MPPIPVKFLSKEAKNVIIGRCHFGQRLGAWPHIRDVNLSKLKLARVYNVGKALCLMIEKESGKF